VATPSELPPPSQRINTDALSHLSDVQHSVLLDLSDECSAAFSDTPGLCPLVQHEIRVTDDFIPKRFQAYRIPEPLKAEVAKQIKQLLDLGFIKPSKSPMVSPIVCVFKKGEGGAKGDVRLCCDYRYLNRYTVGEMVPMRSTEEIIHRVGKANVITTCDCRNSYWQIPIRPEDTWLTAFVMDFGVFEWLRAPFALKWSGNSLLRAMQSILTPLRDFSDSYVDDTSVFSDDWKSHMTDLKTFLLAIINAKLTLNLNKCHFGRPQVSFVGHIIGSGYHSPDPQKVKAVEQIKEPHTKSDLRKIIGFFSYFCAYLPNFARFVRPLTDLTCNNRPNTLDWTEEHKRILEALKQVLCDATKLHVA